MRHGNTPVSINELISKKEAKLSELSNEWLEAKSNEERSRIANMFNAVLYDDVHVI